MTYLNHFRKFPFLIAVIALSFTLFSCEDEIIPEECDAISISASLQSDGSYLIKVDSSILFSEFVWTLDTIDLEDITTDSFERLLNPGEYELCVTATSESCEASVNACITFTVEDTGNGEEECPEVEYQLEVSDSGLHIFELINEDAVSVLWTVDGDTVSQELAIEKDFPAGEYEVCVIATFENCESGVTYCETITVEEECPLLSFEVAIDDNGKYVIDVIDEGPVSVLWTVNGDTVGTGSTIEKEFTAGEYEVCVVGTFEGCSSILSHCETFEIEEECPEIRYSVNSDNNDYEFELNVTDDLKTVKWTINEDTVGHEYLLQKALEPGTYEVCVTATYTDCPSGVSYCSEITVEEEAESGCPEMYFAYQSDGSNKYYFFADFEGIENLEWYGWYVDGALIEDEGTLNEGDNHLEFTFNEPGTHEVCIFTETPECAAGTSYCVDIEIE